MADAGTATPSKGTKRILVLQVSFVVYLQSLTCDLRHSKVLKNTESHFLDGVEMVREPAGDFAGIQSLVTPPPSCGPVTVRSWWSDSWLFGSGPTQMLLQRTVRRRISSNSVKPPGIASRNRVVKPWPLAREATHYAFRELVSTAGVNRKDHAPQRPRLYDFRTTFAVHQITSWIRTGKELNRLLPALSAYLGHGDLNSADRFLALTPDRFKCELDKISPQKGRKWSHDPKLVVFLTGL